MLNGPAASGAFLDIIRHMPFDLRRTCLIDVDLANGLNQLVYRMDSKIKNRDLGFRCPECKQKVSP